MSALPSTNLFSLLPAAPGAGGDGRSLPGLRGRGEAGPDGFFSLVSGALAGARGLARQPGAEAAGQPLLLGQLEATINPAGLEKPMRQTGDAGAEIAGLIGDLQGLLQDRLGSQALSLSSLMQGEQGAEQAFDRLLSDAGIEMSGASLRQTLGQIGVDAKTLSDGLERSDRPARLAAVVIGLSAQVSDAAPAPDARVGDDPGGALTFGPDEIAGAAGIDEAGRDADARRPRSVHAEEPALNDAHGPTLAPNGQDRGFPTKAANAAAEAADVEAVRRETPAIEDPAPEAERAVPAKAVPADLADDEAATPVRAAQSSGGAPKQPAQGPAELPLQRAAGQVADGAAAPPDQAPGATDVEADSGNPLLAQRKANERAAAGRDEAGFSFSDDASPPNAAQQGAAARPQGPQPTPDSNAPKLTETVAAIRAAAAGQGGDGGSMDADLGGGDGQGGHQTGQDKADTGAAGRSDLLNRTNFAQQVALARGQTPQQANVTGQVAMQIQRMAATRTDVLTLQLEPADMGRLDISLEIQEGRVQARVAVENPQTYDLLRQDARALERALHNAGLDTDGGSLSFSLKDQGQQGQGQGQGSSEQRGARATQDQGPLAGDPDPLQAGAVIEARALLTDGRLNLTI